MASGPRGLVEAAVTAVLALGLVAAIIGVVYIGLNPVETTEPYTEFYILGPNGTAEEYPQNLTVGESTTLTVGVTNHEHEQETYTAGILINDTVHDTVTVSVPDTGTAERTLRFEAERTGEYPVWILLYRGSELALDREPYRELRLPVTVTDG